LTTGSTITRDAVTVEARASVHTAGIRSLKLHQNIEWMECETIRQALAMTTEKGQAARLMGISPRALSHYLAKYPFINRNQAQP
jgi:transcriptional regulator with PAS, ATPase and Fis domain